MAAHGSAAARRHVRSNAHSPPPTTRAVAGARTGSSASLAHNAKPPASSGPDSGMRMRLSSGPTNDTRPNTAIHSGSSAAATATLPSSNVAAPRASRGQPSGTRR